MNTKRIMMSVATAIELLMFQAQAIPKLAFGRLTDAGIDTVKKEDGNAKLQELTKRQAEIKVEKQTAGEGSGKAKAATEAKIAEIKGKVAEQMTTVASIVQADVSSRLEKLAGEIQALVGELENVLL